jgi:hypothetical protein
MFLSSLKSPNKAIMTLTLEINVDYKAIMTLTLEINVDYKSFHVIFTRIPTLKPDL